MCQHKGIGHSQEDFGTIKTIPELLKNVPNISEELTELQIGDLVSCQTEGCTNKVIYPLLVCTSCKIKILDNIIKELIE